jgi:hypothetical protein
MKKKTTSSYVKTKYKRELSYIVNSYYSQLNLVYDTGQLCGRQRWEGPGSWPAWGMCGRINEILSQKTSWS